MIVEEQSLIKYCMKKNLILLKIEDMKYIKADLLQWFITFLIKTSSGTKTSGCAVKSEIMLNEELAKEFHKPIIREIEKRKVYSSFMDNICDDDLAHMQLISKFNKGISLLLRVIDIFSKYAWVIPLKDKDDVTIANALQKFLGQSNRKANKIWAEKGSKCYNRSMKSYFQDSDIEMYSRHNEGKYATEVY